MTATAQTARASSPAIPQESGRSTGRPSGDRSPGELRQHARDGRPARQTPSVTVPTTLPVTLPLARRMQFVFQAEAENFLSPDFATQSSSERKARAGFHVGMIMDGNGRWASHRGLPRVAGHRAGVETLRRIADAAPQFGITTLTVFAFSADNWQRPPAEVGALMTLTQRYLDRERDRLAGSGIRLTVIGRRDRLPPRLVQGIAAAEAATAAGQRLRLRIALDYSGRDAIARAACVLGPAATSHAALGRLIAGSDDDGCAPNVDLLIRTGGEKRLSDFLLWESAYAELWFTDRMWPEFGTDDLAAAVAEFQRRERRFGGLGSAKSQPGPGEPAR